MEREIQYPCVWQCPLWTHATAGSITQRPPAAAPSGTGKCAWLG